MKTLAELNKLTKSELIIMVSNLQAQLQSLQWESDCFEKSAQEHTANEMEWMRRFVALQGQIVEAQA